MAMAAPVPMHPVIVAVRFLGEVRLVGLALTPLVEREDHVELVRFGDRAHGLEEAIARAESE